MCEPARHPRFAHEALDHDGFGGGVRAEHLDRHRAPELFVHAFVHDAHSAAPEQPRDAIATVELDSNQRVVRAGTHDRCQSDHNTQLPPRHTSPSRHCLPQVPQFFRCSGYWCSRRGSTLAIAARVAARAAVGLVALEVDAVRAAT